MTEGLGWDRVSRTASRGRAIRADDEVGDHGGRAEAESLGSLVDPSAGQRLEDGKVEQRATECETQDGLLDPGRGRRVDDRIPELESLPGLPASPARRTERRRLDGSDEDIAVVGHEDPDLVPLLPLDDLVPIPFEPGVGATLGAVFGKPGREPRCGRFTGQIDQGLPFAAEGRSREAPRTSIPAACCSSDIDRILAYRSRLAPTCRTRLVR